MSCHRGDTHEILRFLNETICGSNLNSGWQPTDNGQLPCISSHKKESWADMVDDEENDAHVPVLPHEAKGDITTANQPQVMKQQEPTLCVRRHSAQISDGAAVQELVFQDEQPASCTSSLKQSFYDTKLEPPRIMNKPKFHRKFNPAQMINYVSDQPILACACQVLKHMLILLCSGCYFGDKVCNCVEVPLSPSQCRRMADNLRMIFPGGFRITLLQYSEKPIRFMHGFYTCFDRSFDFIPSVVVDRFNHILFVGMACSFFPSNVKRLLMNQVPV